MNLEQLTILVLSLSETPLTRIRLAKTLYFVHKELVHKKLMTFQDISYIRLPLGPAPEGLSGLLDAHPDILAQDSPVNLLYDNKTYTLKATEKSPNFDPKIISYVQKILKLLDNYRTPELVHASQEDPSWLAHLNGERYQFTSADLKNPFPNPQLRLKIHIKTTPNDIGALQATLLRGMLADIVKESTDLEYPDQATPDKAPNDSDSIKLRRFTIKLPGWPKKKDK